MTIATSCDSFTVEPKHTKKGFPFPPPDYFATRFWGTGRSAFPGVDAATPQPF